MSQLLDDMGTFLVAAGLGLQLDVNFFLGTMPDSPDVVVVLYEYQGDVPTQTLGGGLPSKESPRLQLQTRAAQYDYEAARTKCWDVWKVLAVVVNQSVNSIYYGRIAPLQSPFFLSRDERERVLFASNFEVWKDVA